MGTPCLPPIGFERQFKRKSRIIDGGGDESLEVGVLKYKEGPGIGMFRFLSSLLFSVPSHVLVPLVLPFFVLGPPLTPLRGFCTGQGQGKRKWK